MSSTIFPKALKKTKPRMLVLHLMEKEQRPMGAQEISNLLAEEGTPVWLSSVYRVLDDFTQHHVVRKTDFVHLHTAVYELTTAPHQHYALCKKCKKATPLDTCPLEKLEQCLEHQGFYVEEHEIQMYGYCKKCRK